VNRKCGERKRFAFDMCANVNVNDYRARQCECHQNLCNTAAGLDSKIALFTVLVVFAAIKVLVG
jgi:hypothetical protein